MKHRLRGPARSIALGGAVIVILVATSVGVAIWRYNDALGRYHDITEQAQTLSVIGEMRQKSLFSKEIGVFFCAFQLFPFQKA